MPLYCPYPLCNKPVIAYVLLLNAIVRFKEKSNMTFQDDRQSRRKTTRVLFSE